MSRKRSRQIGIKGARTLYYAIDEHAERIGLPLTHYVTINFSLAGVAPEAAVGIFQTLRNNHFSKWARRPCKNAGKPFQPAFAYCFENERDGTAYSEIEPGMPHNVHVHWYVHIPGQRLFDFTNRMHGWLDSLCDHITPERSIDIKPIEEIKPLRGYGLKGTDPFWAKRFGATYEDQGLIVGGRRTGTTINLGPKARIKLDRAMGIRRRAA